MTDIVTSDVILLAKWHENEAVRLRKHPDTDMASTHGLAEMHGETASTLYMLLAERDQLRENITLLDGLWHEYHDAYVLQVEENDRLKNDLEAAIMDADMQAREAGNMEYNARVLMTERDQLREAVEALMTADDYWLRGNKDNQWASMMAAARAKARGALKEAGHE